MNWCCLQRSRKGRKEKLKGYHIWLEDGTEVIQDPGYPGIQDNDYFNILPSQTFLIVSKPSELSPAYQDKMGLFKTFYQGKTYQIRYLCKTQFLKINPKDFNFDMIMSPVCFILQGTMESLEQKVALDLPFPDEIIEDSIMVFLSLQDLYNMIKVGNSRLKDCAHRVIRKRQLRQSKFHLSIVSLTKLVTGPI